MRKSFTSMIAVICMASIPLAVSTTPAAAVHKHWHKGLATGVGVGVGLGIVGALTRPRERQVIVQQPAPVYVQPAPQPVYGGLSQAHYNYCFAKFRSYHAPSNSYMSFSGVRKPCYSPY